MTERPVVAGVGDTRPEDVVVQAAQEATLRRRGLRLVHAYPAPPAGPSGAASSAARRAYRAATELVGAQRPLLERSAPGLPVEIVVREGGRAEVLVQAAQDAELLVVGAGDGPRGGESCGAVAAQVAAHTRCPVLVVRTGLGGGPDAGRPVAVGVTGPDGPAAVLETAFEEAQRRGLGLLALHADGDALEGVDPDEKVLTEVLAPWSRRYPTVDVERRTTHGSAAEALVRVSDEARLLVVGRRGSGGFTALLLGSTSDAAVRYACCPVLVVHGTCSLPGD